MENMYQIVHARLVRNQHYLRSTFRILCTDGHAGNSTMYQTLVLKDSISCHGNHFKGLSLLRRPPDSSAFLLDPCDGVKMELPAPGLSDPVPGPSIPAMDDSLSGSWLPPAPVAVLFLCPLTPVVPSMPLPGPLPAFCVGSF